MDAISLFYLIIGILVFDFLLDQLLGYLNYTWYSKNVPQELNDVYDADEYAKSQEYKKTNYRFSLLSSSISFIAILIFLFYDGFALIDTWARTLVNHDTLVGLLFFTVIAAAGEIISLPFSYYSTFVIEEKFGFNKTTIKTFIIDKIKGWLLTAILGGGILSLVIICYDWAGANFWWYVWILIFEISLLMNMFYARWFVPLFNKQTPLEEGTLKTSIGNYAQGVGFQLDKIFVIDGSKRSTKANAYFSGFGSEKRVTLYDTLISKLTEEEIVAVLAHEVGHYKRKHIIYNLIASTITTGFTLWLFSLFVDSATLSEALGVAIPSFHVGLVAFGLLYSPISTITGIVMSSLSRKFEYEADAFAKDTYKGEPLIDALKKLNKTSLSNLTPHPAYVFFNYSHPTLYQRMMAMREN
ncbi:M48 family metallopeptidase [Nonlabens ulvanivorans]|uniref:M48 family metallopeptidase n=1 Tax=Nonlabens ulvanivorans TaxID=906888 RepID=UPI002942D9A7|nr:M48 family metallopeptidase [Nonlabens ulvanivorans]WOI23723.1 M48 family metallopeptidase [Nonlabens ulvanivorans]